MLKVSHPNYTLSAVRNEPKPVLRYPSIRSRLSTYLNANYGHLKISFLQKDKRILENNGSFLAANRVHYDIFVVNVKSSLSVKIGPRHQCVWVL